MDRAAGDANGDSDGDATGEPGASATLRAPAAFPSFGERVTLTAGEGWVHVASQSAGAPVSGLGEEPPKRRAGKEHTGAGFGVAASAGLAHPVPGRTRAGHAKATVAQRYNV